MRSSTTCQVGKHAAVQVIHVVALENKGLQPPEGTPPQLASLMRACMAHDPSKRPTFAAVVSELGRLSTQPAMCASP